MGARSLRVILLLGFAALSAGCNPLGYPDCYRSTCPFPPAYHNTYAGYTPAYTDGRAAVGEAPFDDPFADYTRRSLTISPGAGNAQASNTALQTVTPWPRYSRDTNIPGDGAQMVKGVQQFESGTRPSLAPVASGAAGSMGAPNGAPQAGGL